MNTLNDLAEETDEDTSSLHKHPSVEHRVREFARRRLHISRDVNREWDENSSFGERLADRVAAFGGSWPFIISFLCLLSGWIAINSLYLKRHAFDPYPYILLNLVLSMVSSLQAPVIMMSQNRQSAKDRLDAQHDYEVNLKSEVEIMALHEKIDHLREQQWQQLVDMQQEQIRLLTRLLEEKGRSISS